MCLNPMMVNTLDLALILDSETFAIQPKIVHKNTETCSFPTLAIFPQGVFPPKHGYQVKWINVKLHVQNP